MPASKFLGSGKVKRSIFSPILYRRKKVNFLVALNSLGSQNAALPHSFCILSKSQAGSKFVAAFANFLKLLKTR